MQATGLRAELDVFGVGNEIIGFFDPVRTDAVESRKVVQTRARIRPRGGQQIVGENKTRAERTAGLAVPTRSGIKIFTGEETLLQGLQFASFDECKVLRRRTHAVRIPRRRVLDRQTVTGA